MADEKQTKPEDEPGEFAAEVLDTFGKMLAKPGAPYAGNAKRDVRRCASGLSLMRLLLDRFMRDGTLPPGAQVQAGAGEAYAILDHLTSGRKHPIALHIRGLHTDRFYKHSAPANEFDRLVQRLVAGVVLAIQRTKNLKERAAVREVVGALDRLGSEFSPTQEQVRAWCQKFDGLKDQGPHAFATEIIKRAEARQTSPFYEGVNLIFEYTGGEPKVD